MRYVVEMMVICREDEFPAVRDVLGRHGLSAPFEEPLRIRFEKSDSRRHEIERELQDIGHEAHISYKPAFAQQELEMAELVLLRVQGFCGDAFETWAKRLDLPPGTRVKDKREMGKLDIARTYARKEILISERLKEMLVLEGLTGWRAEPVQHRDPSKDRFPPLYELLSTNELPPLAPETDLYVDKHENLPRDDFLYGTTALFERGPLCYRRRDLMEVADVNRTQEVFLETMVAHSYIILSQRALRTFQTHRVRGNVEFEPVVILE